MAHFNSRTPAERDAVLGPLPLLPDEVDEDDLPHDRPLPLLRPAPDAELDAAAIASVTMGRVATFTRFVQQPRKLTSKGHLSLADGKVLAQEVWAGRRVRPHIRHVAVLAHPQHRGRARDHPHVRLGTGGRLREGAPRLGLCDGARTAAGHPTARGLGGRAPGGRRGGVADIALVSLGG